MNNAIEHYPVGSSHDDEISLVEVANTILRHWRVVVFLPVLFALVAGVWSYNQERSYAASASFMPQGAGGRGATGVSALAQQFGFNLGAEQPGQSPQFYVDLLRSRALLRQAVEAEYQIPTDEGRLWSGTLVQYWELDEEEGLLPPWRRATETLRDAMSESVNLQTGVVQLTISSAHPVLAERIAERLVDLLNEYNLAVVRRRAQEEGRFISGRMTEAQAELRAAEGAVEEFLRQNREFRNAPELMFEHDRLQRQVVIRQEVYTSLLRSHEQARIDAVQDIPLFTVIDHPAGTAEPQGRGTIMRGVLGFLLGLLVAVFVAFFAEAARKRRNSEDPRYREFQMLAREAWNDVWHPGRWVRRRE